MGANLQPQEIICYKPESRLVILSSPHKATKEEQTARLAKYACILAEWAKKGEKSNAS